MKSPDGPRLSVALCTCNGEKYLGTQLESLLAKMRLPDEVVVGDDGSSDASWSMLEVFARRAGDVGIEVHLCQNRVNVDYVENFSATLGAAIGDVVFTVRPGRCLATRQACPDDLAFLHRSLTVAVAWRCAASCCSIRIAQLNSSSTCRNAFGPVSI